eukprot:TRINITY_DN1562_c0_g1_i17.p1 TRINITY_DN1562_c0_g1~~TRINITY_DN1562_c0_g1_i17.p1  ORF type:complete len:135 (-),score=13.98 TRINITY_DN1562_c0_g1_i17:48-452(-)
MSRNALVEFFSAKKRFPSVPFLQRLFVLHFSTEFWSEPAVYGRQTSSKAPTSSRNFHEVQATLLWHPSFKALQASKNWGDKSGQKQTSQGVSESMSYNTHLQFPLSNFTVSITCLLYTSPSPRDGLLSRMPSSA